MASMLGQFCVLSFGLVSALEPKTSNRIRLYRVKSEEEEETQYCGNVEVSELKKIDLTL